MLVHEARHLEGEYGHQTCARGERAGKANECDARFSLDGTTGAFSHGFTTMLWLAHHSDYPAAERHEILRLLDWEIVNRFNDLTDEAITRIREDQRLR